MEKRTCLYCDKEFASASNLHRHFRDVHKIDKTNSGPKDFKCLTCGKEFSSQSSLNRHKVNLHIEENGQSKLAEPEGDNRKFKTKRQHQLSDDECIEDGKKRKIELKCKVCDNAFSCTSTLNRHLRLKHAVEPENDEGKMKCPKCETAVSNFYQLDNHLKNVHDCVLNHESKFFSSITEFEKWKREVEERQASFFYKRSTKNNLVYYRCNRSGESKRTVSDHRMHWAPLTKVGHACPARMILRTELDGYYVEFQGEHVGHDLSMRYLRLTKQERIELAGKLEQKKSMDVILDEIFDNIMDNHAPIGRFEATTKKDLHNIMQEFRLVKSKLCRDDVVSTDMWVKAQEALGNVSCVLGFKRQGETDPMGLLQDDDLCLIIMTKYQRDMVAQFSSDKLFIDSTHKTTGYDFQLTSLVTIDDYDTGCPIAFCLSSRVDTRTMTYFFKCIKNKIGVLSSEVFMSDDAPAFYNAWISVMTRPKHRLLCTWHVDKNWRENIKVKVRGAEKQADVYKGCRLLLETLDEKEFDENLTNFMAICKDDPETEDFYKYFRDHYSNRPQLWAYCFRKKLRLNTNMYLESLHKKLKYCYLDGCQNRRVDKCIEMLLRCSQRLMINRMIQKMKNMPSYRMTNIGNSHRQSLEIKEEQIKKISDNKWEVQSSRKAAGPYVVQIDSDAKCEGCPLTCPVCKICVHQFECTCVDYSIKGNFCKHIHACIKPPIKMLPDMVNDEETIRFEREVKAITEEPTPGHVNKVDKRLKLKSMLDSIYALSANVTDDGLDSLMGTAERLFDKTKSLADASNKFVCNEDASSDTTSSPATRI